MQIKKQIAIVVVVLAALSSIFFRFFTLADRMTHCDDSGFLIQGLAASNAIDAGHRIASYWTYAPGQFVLGYPLWSIAGTWRNALFAARLPSAIAGTLAALLIVWLLSKLSRDNELSPFAGIFSAVLGLCSLRAMVESQQGYPYASACLCVALTAAILYGMTSGSSSVNPARLPILIGILAVWGSLAVWISYQMTISIAASILSIVLVAYPDLRKPGALRQISVQSWMAGFLLSFTGAGAFFGIWKLYLADRLLNNRGVPPWAAFDLIHWSNSPIEYLQAIVMKWISFAGFSTTPLWPPESGTLLTQCLGVLVLLLVCFGLKTSDQLWIRAISWYCVLMLGAGFLLSLFGKMPFGVTRHSHFLLPALLLLSGFGEANLLAKINSRRPGSPIIADWLLAGCSMTVLIVFFFSFPTFHRATRNQFDMDQLAQLARDQKPLKILGSGCTYDAAAAQLVSHNQLFACSVTSGFLEDQFEAALKMVDVKPAPASIFIVDHRGDPDGQLRNALKKYPSLRSSLLVGIKATGSTEMMGNINGGNGFFVRQISKSQPGTDSLVCKATFLDGWHAHEAGPKGWWRWSNGNPTIRVVTNRDFVLQWQGTLMSMIWPQKIDISVDGQRMSTWDAKETIDFKIPIHAGENIIQLNGRTPGVRSATDTRLLSFGLQNLVLRTSEKPAGICDLD